MKSSYIVLVVLGGIILSSCTHMSVVESPAPILIHVNNSGSASITTPGSGKCKIQNQGKNGCVHIDQGKTGLITFRMTGPTGWALKTFEICKVIGGNNVCDLNVWERMEFVVTNDAGDKMLIPDSEGRVNLADISTSLDTFILLDQNRIAQEYYYRVEVCKGADCTWADPPLENGGIKGN